MNSELFISLLKRDSNLGLGVQYLKELNDEIVNLQKHLFAYHLIHAYGKRPKISIGLENRDKELCERGLYSMVLIYGKRSRKHFSIFLYKV